MKRILYTTFCVLTSMVSYTLYKSVFWAIICFFVAPVALMKWLVFKELTLTVIKHTFNFLTQ